MLKSSGAMAGATMTSRLLGMVREMVYARFMGDGWVAGAFQVAFTIPNLFRRLLGEGALTAAFIPIFKEKEKTAGEQEMWRAANAVISGLVVASAVVIALVLAGVTVALKVHDFPVQEDLMLRLLRWMFPYMLLVCLAAAFMGMLNARGHFFIPAMGATMLNVVMIASVLWLAPHMGLRFPEQERLPHQIFALAFGVLVAGVAQAAFQWPTLWRDGFRYHWVSPWRDETVGRVVRRMIPGAIGVAAFPINVVIIQGLGLWLDTPEHPLIAPFNYSVRLMELPQGVFGISLATFLLPTLSGLAVEKNYAEFRSTLRQGIAHLILLNLLMSVLLVTLAEPIIRLLFERGKFTPDSTMRATLALECLGPSLVAYSVVNVLARAFYALGDVKTPMKISMVCLALNLIFAVCLVWPFRQGGLGLANTVSSAFNVALLLYVLRRKLGKLDLEPLRATLLPLAGAGALAVLISWWGARFWEHSVGHQTLALKIGAVFVPGAVAGLVYWLIALAAKVPAAKEITHLIFRRFIRAPRS
jgi:putative peptidoglycan lipid II flippase